MKKLFVEDVRIGESEGGIACGPCSGNAVVEVRFHDEEGKAFFISNVECDGIPNFYMTDESAFDKLIEEDFDNNEEFYDHMNNECFMEAGEYYDIFSDQDPDWFDAYRYVIYLTRCADEEVEPFIKATVGKWLHECDIPASDVEEEYNEDYCDEDDEDEDDEDEE